MLVSSEDAGHRLLRAAHREAPGRVVYLAHTPQFFAFGPASWNPDAASAELVRRAAAVVAIGRHMADYIREHLGRAATVVHPPVYGGGPYPDFGNFGRGLITILNPCAVKGIDIFLALAERFPAYEFGYVPGWGTTAAGRAALERLPNVRRLPNPKEIDRVLEQTRVLLMPSIWYEGFGLIAMEAMLRGIPVVASDSGGLKEAKQGTGFVIPVPHVERYEPVFDERGLPKPVLPPLDAEPWATALRELLGDRRVYERESRASREAALRFVNGVDPDAFTTLLAALQPAGLHILLAHNSTYFPAHGGGDKSNRLLVEALAARGHACRVIARTAGYGAREHERYLADLAARNIQPEAVDSGTVGFQLNGVDVRVVTGHANLRGYFADRIAAFAPDVILTSTDDPAQLLFDAALKAERARVVHLVRTTLAVPFGPDCAFPSEAKTEMFRQADATVGVSQYVADYVRRWSGIDAMHVPISPMDPGPWPGLGRFGNEFVAMVNPCAVKGIAIFLALADAMPEMRFAAVPTWGTNERDRAELRARSNIAVLDPVDDIDDLLRRTRVLLVPSLWAEARSRIVVEAMLRGVPVIAANVGGIPEAKLGVPYLLPVRQIERYRPAVDEQMVPVADVPAQDIGPWREALERLTGDRAHWEGIARESREAAVAWAEQLGVEPFEALLRDVVRRPRRARAAAPRAEGQTALDRLSPEKRHLLALRLRKKAAAGAWFPAAPSGAAFRLFCFPHAGGGASAFAVWQGRLPPDWGVVPVRLPGRETRCQEAPFTRMEPLISALAGAIEPRLDQPFAFYGHSMGAAVAFELARRLREKERPMPMALFVSAARAPQFRRNWSPPPEPSDEEFLDQLRRLEGMPPELLADHEYMRLFLPALKPIQRCTGTTCTRRRRRSNARFALTEGWPTRMSGPSTSRRGASRLSLRSPRDSSPAGISLQRRRSFWSG